MAEQLDEALAALFAAFDRSGLTDLRWFVPYMEAVREAWKPDESRTSIELSTVAGDDATA